MGGFVAGPGGLAARISGCPLVIHEQNAVAGFTNRILASFANVVAEAFPGAFSASARALSIGNPVRNDISRVGAQRGAMHHPPRLLVFGGSQGAMALNRIVPAALAAMPSAQRPIVVHQTGRGRVEATQAMYQSLDVDADVREFIDDMANAYQWADLVIARSGALTVAELAAAGVPALLVPFPAAVDDHQTANARYLSDCGAALLIPEKDLEPAALAESLLGMTGDGGSKLLDMSRRALSVAKIGTDVVLADLCLAQIKRRAA
jgi:UDP-N-acetylglucosamine--N-acetylmuramyl-(pentapeptide) pyrophosphoryl-undecaprenol N-acetylglucosamine transferase